MGEWEREILTEVERVVLRLLKDGPLTVKQISRRRKTSKQATNRLLRSMEKKGVLARLGTLIVSYGSTHISVVKKRQHIYKENAPKCCYTDAPNSPSEVEHSIRLHAEEWQVRLLRDSARWHEARAKATSIIEDGNRVVLNRDNLTIYSMQSFEGVDDADCDGEANVYWLRFFHRLEKRFAVLLLKDRSWNVRRVKAHYAEVGNELSKELREHKQTQVRVYGSRDGKEWLLFDNSFNLDEAETTHAPTPPDQRDAKEDMAKVVQPFFNDLRDHPSNPLPSQQAATQAHHERLMEQIVKALEQQVLLNAQSQLKPGPVEEESRGPKDAPLKRPDYLG